MYIPVSVILVVVLIWWLDKRSKNPYYRDKAATREYERNKKRVTHKLARRKEPVLRDTVHWSQAYLAGSYLRRRKSLSVEEANLSVQLSFYYDVSKSMPVDRESLEFINNVCEEYNKDWAGLVYLAEKDGLLLKV